MKKMVFSFVLVTIVTALLFCTISTFSQAVPEDNASSQDSAADMPFMLLQIQADAQGSLNDLDSDVANASQNLSATGLDGAAARDVLRKLLETNSNLVEAVTFDREGRIIIAECKGCDGGEGEWLVKAVVNELAPAIATGWIQKVFQPFPYLHRADGRP